MGSRFILKVFATSSLDQCSPGTREINNKFKARNLLPGLLLEGPPLYTKLIKDLDEMGSLAFTPPCLLMESLADAERRGERWWVLMAYERNSEQARWVSGCSGFKASQFFSEGLHLDGRWDPDHELFIPEEGPAFDLNGKPVSLTTIAEEEEAADWEEAEKKWEIFRQLAREEGSLSWD